MTKTVSPLDWQEQAQAGQPLAPYTLDFSADPTWQFGLPSFYLQNSINPAGVAVDLTQLNTTVTVACGPLNVTVPAFVRQNIPLPSNALTATFTSSGTSDVPIAFYMTAPTGPWLNQFGASAALSGNVFIGGTTTGAANVQAITVSPASSYAFNNGVIISCTAGFTNAGGGFTISVNGGPATTVVKNTPAPGTALSANDIVAGQGIIIQGDTTTGNFILLNPQQVSAVPSGIVSPFAGAAAPTGWLICDGSSQLTATFPALFAAIGYAFGGAGGNFNLPDLRGRAVFGVDGGAGRLGGGPAGGIVGAAALAASGGEQGHSLLPLEAAQNVMSDFNAGPAIISPASGGSVNLFSGQAHAHNTTPPALVLNYIIKT